MKWKLTGLILLAVAGLAAVVPWASGCHAPTRCVGSTSLRVEELQRREQAAYGPDVERVEWGQ